MQPIALCTTNEGKRREFTRILGVPLRPVAADLAEIQAIDSATVCRDKAAQAFAAIGAPVLVDDTAFELAALNHFPGALVAWVIRSGGAEMLHRMVPPQASPAATAITTVGYADEHGIHIFTGTLAGTCIAKPRGNTGFGFDSVFVPDGHTQTLAEMPPELKDSISPRGIALRQVAAFLAGLAPQS